MPFFCIKNQIWQIINLEWGANMIYNLNYKKIISLLILGLILIGGFLWYREETTNKKVPKRADFVNLDIKRIEMYG